MEIQKLGTPFDDANGSVYPLARGCNDVAIVVAPNGIERFPQYLVEFDGTVGVRIEDESYNWATTPRGPLPTVCELFGSQWLEELSEASGMLATGDQFRHLVFLGGDYSVEVITTDPSDPAISEITSKQELPGWY